MLDPDPTPEASKPLSPIDRLVADAPVDAVLVAVMDELAPMLTRSFAAALTRDRWETRNRIARGDEPLNVESTATMTARSIGREIQQMIGELGPEGGKRLLRQAGTRQAVELTRSFITSLDLGPKLGALPERHLGLWWAQQCGFDRLAGNGQESLSGVRPATPERLSESEVPSPIEESS